MDDINKRKYNTMLYNVNIIIKNINEAKKDLKNLDSCISEHFLINDKKIEKERIDKSINSLNKISDDIKYGLISSIKRQLN